MQVFSVQHVLVEGSLSIVATVTDHPRVVRKWINNVSNSLQKVEMNVIGLDAEYTERATGKIKRAAVLQLCIEDDVLVYHIIHTPSIPENENNKKKKKKKKKKKMLHQQQGIMDG
uniref:3'-5' exonuclease domain-containing protein n=1 Tax=Aegilops tauschii TaxID=37682 RepID=R7WCZ1_AEGTA